MAQGDVYRTATGLLLIDCQSDTFEHLAVRLTVPLIPLDRSPERRPGLNPVFDIGDVPHVMVTQFAAAVSCNELGDTVADLSAFRIQIVGAFDMLLTGV
ncbi:CcdB family protein [Sphingomonas sp. A2-49]|uniref:CcdB family protein n=1 Tax=Sphingomonas sp. A2-49 TaxID=1391375 RepID=UPI0021D0327C|nr:CcdB family protein [Sphingomonas sp. A2-49]MCU6455124.1 CcdB family protein [Sphingomonas sp. A2-49]